MMHWYRAGATQDCWDNSKAFRILLEESGKQFDPELIDIFFCCVDSIQAIRTRYPD